MKFANERINKRVIEYHRKRGKCTQYKIGEQVFVRFGKKHGKKAPKRRFVILGTVVKIGKNDNTYKIKFKNPKSSSLMSDWFSVEDIADFKKKADKINDNNTKHNKSKYYIPLTKNDRYALFNDQGYTVLFDPPGDGNCQFHALSNALGRFGIHRSAQLLRADIINYFEDNQNDQDLSLIHI